MVKTQNCAVFKWIIPIDFKDSTIGAKKLYFSIIKIDSFFNVHFKNKLQIIIICLNSGLKYNLIYFIFKLKHVVEIYIKWIFYCKCVLKKYVFRQHKKIMSFKITVVF